MGKFSIRLDDATEKVLSNIMKQERFKTKNSCIEEIIKSHIKLKGSLQQKIRELNNLNNEYEELYSILQSKIMVDRRIHRFFNVKMEKGNPNKDFDPWWKTLDEEE